MGKFVPKALELKVSLKKNCFRRRCCLIAVARSPGVVYASISLSLLSNLVYPAVTSLVSSAVPPDRQGEALGAINGVKALTEGLGPLAFAPLMATFERTALPGAPYFACAAVSGLALAVSFRLPSPDEDAARRNRDDAAGAELVGLLARSDSDDDDEEGGADLLRFDEEDAADERRRRDAAAFRRFSAFSESFRPSLSTAAAAFAPVSRESPPFRPPRARAEYPPDAGKKIYY